MRKRFITRTAWIVFITLSCCYKNGEENYAEEEIIIEDVAAGIREADDALEVAYYAEAIQKTFNNGRKTADCGAIVYDPANKMITLDFGTDGCLGLFNRTRQGKIIINYDTLADSLYDKSITFENYLVNGKKIGGAVSLHDISFKNADSVQVATRTLTDFNVEFVNNISITFNGNQTRTWSSGKGDTLLTNNVYSFLGSMGGVTSTGRTFQQDITTTVIVNFYCASLGFFPSTFGVVELSQLQGFPNRKRTVDYGTGICDQTISVETFRRTYGASVN